MRNSFPDNELIIRVDKIGELVIRFRVRVDQRGELPFWTQEQTHEQLQVNTSSSRSGCGSTCTSSSSSNSSSRTTTTTLLVLDVEVVEVVEVVEIVDISLFVVPVLMAQEYSW
jgi:hypothetical protein